MFKLHSPRAGRTWLKSGAEERANKRFAILTVCAWLVGAGLTGMVLGMVTILLTGFGST